MAEQRWRAYREGQGRVSILAKLSFSIPSRQKPRTLAPVARFLQRDLALVVETHIDPVTDLIVNSTRDRNASRHSNAFEPRCNIDAIAEDIVVVDDDVSKMDADAELDPLGLGYLRVLVSHAALNFDGASRCIDGTGKFDQQTVAGGLDDAAAMFGDCGVDKRSSESLQLRQRAFLVGTIKR